MMSKAVTNRQSRLVLIAVAVCATIGAAVPAFFLFYAVLGNVLFGAALLLGLIGVQYVALLPLWKSIQSRAIRADLDGKAGQNHTEG